MFIGIVADDLTGAADSVAPFAQEGYAAGVCLWGKEVAELRWDALAMSTGLRDMHHEKPTLVASIARKITRRMIARAPQIYYKKIDSTLRGHLRTELDGMLRELPGRIALVCSASPANGRTVENGVVFVGGIPLAQSEFMTGVEDAGRFASVRTAFEYVEDPTAAEIGLTTVRAGTDFLEAELDHQIGTGVRTFFFDAVTPEDLRTLAQIVLRRPEYYLPVGSAGWTRAIAESLPAVETPELPPWDNELFVQGRILVLIGSMHPMSRRQARRLIGKPGVKHTVLRESDADMEFLAAVLNTRERPTDEKLLVVMTSEETRPDGHAYSFTAPFYWLEAEEANGSIVVPFDGYVITGGETAGQVFSVMRSTHLQVFGESEPGIVRALLHQQPGLASVPVILKAGGFGDEGTLARCVGLE